MWFSPLSQGGAQQGPVYADADMVSAGTSTVALSSSRIVNAAATSAGVATSNLITSRIANATASSAGSSSATFDDESTYPAVEPERFIEVLGAELLHFEIVGENKGPNYSEADMTASGLANLVIGAARVLPTLHASAGSGATSISARAIGTAGVTSAGSAVSTLNTTRIAVTVASAAGSAAAVLTARAIAQAAASAAGSSTIAAQTQALKDAVANGSGSSSVFAPTQVLVQGSASLQGSSAASLIGRLVQSGGLSAEGSTVSTLTGLGIARFIEAQDMSRTAEGRAMDRGFPDNRMNKQPEGGIERPEENRSMEVTA